MSNKHEDLRWNGQRESLDDPVIDVVESFFGVALPADYRECLKTYHGASPEVSDFKVTLSHGEAFTSCVGVLLSADPADPESIAATYEGLGDSADPKLIPIIDDGGGDFVCLDYRVGRAVPRIAYFRSEVAKVEELAESFEAFCEMLHEPH